MAEISKSDYRKQKRTLAWSYPKLNISCRMTWEKA